MKHLFICLLMATIALSTSAQEQVSKDVLVKKAGTLATIIPPDELCQITHLRIVGKINGADIRWIRKMAGATDDNDSIDYRWGQLVDLDLNDVEIVKGKASYLDAHATERWRHSTTYTTRLGKYKSRSSFSESYDLGKPLTPEQWKEFRSAIGTKQDGRFYTIDDQGYVITHYTTENNILGFIFNTQQKPQPETVLEISYFLQKWREYAEDIAGKRADQLINQAKEILTKYKNDLTESYIGHITVLISQETEKKDQVIATLSEEERLLQNDMDWLHEIEDKLTRIERE